MDRILEYRVEDSDPEKTANGILGKVLKHCMGLTPHEISHAKFIPNGITVLKKGDPDGMPVPVTVKDRVEPGDVVRVRFSETGEDADSKVAASKGDIWILYEDEDVVVLDKPAGVVSHPSHGHYRDSLANYLAGYYESKSVTVKLRTVGRLDKDTSGVILYAKNAPAASRLFRQKESGQFKKTYLAVVENPEQNIEKDGWNLIDLPIGPVPGTLMKQQIISPPAGRNALTRYMFCAQRDDKALILAEIETGRTHQIRVHMASTGHPLTGDKLYGEESVNNDKACRTLLHAWKAEFRQPFSGEEIRITAPVPEDIRDYYGENFWTDGPKVERR
ncbi:MAG: RluA family pseudouridine synthase [Lachnospiraceae bacterium]|nr:RluA family pseudouridine synthase [Lachnospiraceae bacterium]